MKSRSLLIFILIVSLAVVPSLQLALAASTSSSSTTTTTSTSTTTTISKAPYSEVLNIYTAGDNDYWLASLSPVNANKTGLTAAESVSGLNGYELTAIMTSAAPTSAQLFWADGYKIVNLPFMPGSGVFLNVTATSQAAAQSAAADFGSSLGVNFEQIGSSGDNYTFFSSVNFATAGAMIFKAVPASYGGLAGLANATSLPSEETPTEILTGVRSGSSFTHTVSFGSSETDVVGSNQSLLLSDALDIVNDSFTSSANATSTQVYLHSLDGLIESTDPATISNHQANFSATYSFSVPSGTKFRPNVTLLQDPPVLTATRSVTSGSAAQGGLVTVTLNIANTGSLFSSTGTITNINLNDNWWTAYPSLFSLSAGNSTVNIPTLAEGQNVSRVYVLKVNSATSEDLTVPSAKVTYTYGSGMAVVNATTQTNELEVRTNDAGPAMSITASTSDPSGSPVGAAAKWVVTVTNTGSAPAVELKVLNNTNPTLIEGGTPWTFNTTIPLTSIVNRNLTQVFTLGWTNPDGSTGTLTSNPATLILSHSGVELPFLQFTLNTTLSSQAVALGSVNATYALKNLGNVQADSASASQPLPPGVVCKSVVSGNATCGSSGLSLVVSPLASDKNSTGVVLLTFSTDNYVIQPASLTAMRFGLSLDTAGSGSALPAGVVVTKTFLVNPVFQGQDDNVTVLVTNRGTLPVYNVNVTTSEDVFDTTTAGALSAQYPTLNASSSQSYNYTVEMTSSGVHNSTSATVAFDFGGAVANYAVSPSPLTIYKPLHATATTVANPVEGEDFSLAVNVQNPSPATVTNVALSIVVPKGVTIVNYSSGFTLNGRTATLSLPSLAAGATSSNYLTLKADFDGNVNLGSGKLTFVYLGSTIQGIVSNPTISVGAELLLHYELPIGAAVLLTLGIAFYMHRKLVVPQVK
jgi:hypothetical protein